MTLDVLALAVAGAGLLTYSLSDRWRELGRIAFAVGLLVLVAHAGVTVRV